MKLEIEKQRIGIRLVLNKKFLNCDSFAITLIPPKGVKWYKHLFIPYTHKRE